MDLAEIHALGAEVQRVAARDCALFLWVTMPMLPQGLATMAAWGFQFSTCAFTWAKVAVPGPLEPVRRFDGWRLVKPQIGTGYWTRANAELCLLGTRGHPKRMDSGVPQLILAPRREHSRKPPEVHERIERLMGPARRLEMFSRETRSGWTQWGLEIGKFDGE
jgi:N6-adenosine-specific RNA methylase IME4